MKSKTFKIVTAVVLTVVMIVGLVAMELPSGLLNVYAADKIAINETNFDARVCTYLSENYDNNDDGHIDDVSQVTYIRIADSTTPVASLKGFEKLTNLTNIEIWYGTFEGEADLTVCPNLSVVCLRQCENITSVNVTGLSKLEELLITDSEKVNTVNGVDKLPELKEITIKNTEITELDLSGNTNLTDIEVLGNKLTSLKVAGLSKLATLSCSYNNLPELDLTGCTAIETLKCAHNSWSSGEPLDLTKIPNVKYIDISGPSYIDEDTTERQIQKITFPTGCKLEKLYVRGNALTSLDVTNCTELQELYCGENPLAALNLNNSKLTFLDMSVVYTDSETSYALDTSKCPALENLNLSGNYMINAVEVSKNTALEKLRVDGTEITSLDVTKNTALKTLKMDSRDITSLDLRNNTELKSLDLEYAGLTSLDVSMLTKLETLKIDSVPITRLDLSGLSSLKTLYANYSYGGDQYDVLESIDFSGCTGLTYVELENIDNLHSVDLSDSSLLEELEIDLAKVLVCKLPASNTTMVIDESQNRVYLENVGETFDLKTIVPDIDASKIKNVKGSEENSTVAINGTVLSGYQLSENITYQYDCGNGMVINPELYVRSLEKLENSWTTALSIEGWTYGEAAKNPSAAAKYGTVKFTYSNEADGNYTETKPGTAGTWYVKATVEETDEYAGLESEAVSFVIEKAVPGYTVPTGLTAKAGQTLADVELPDGFTWNNESQSVGTKGSNTFTATYTPADTANYKVVSNVSVVVAVELNGNEWTRELAIEGWTYGEEANVPSAVAKYGTVKYTYSDEADGNYTETKPSTAGTWYVKATVEETDEYAGLESEAVSFVIEKAVPGYTVPTGLTAKAGQTLADVKLADGFIWKNEATSVGNAGNNKFMAIFTPSDAVNYAPVEVELTVSVSEKVVEDNVADTDDNVSDTGDNVADTDDNSVDTGDIVAVELLIMVMIASFIAFMVVRKKKTA